MLFFNQYNIKNFAHYFLNFKLNLEKKDNQIVKLVSGLYKTKQQKL